MRLLVAIVVSGLLLAGCPANPQDNSVGTPSASPTVSATASALSTAPKGRTVIKWDSPLALPSSAHIKVDDQVPCLTGFWVEVTGFTPNGYTLITIDDAKNSYHTTERKQNDGNGTVTYQIGCDNFTVGDYTARFKDETKPTYVAKVDFASIA